MSNKVENAIIMAAGKSSRFAPLSHEKPKALVEVKGEIMLERQISQIKDAGIDEIIIVTGYMAGSFNYLKNKFGVKLINNDEYMFRNNNSSIYAAKEFIGNSYICSSDNYFSINPFEKEVDDAYYAAVFSKGETSEWCMTEGEDGYIDSVCVGGSNSWYMLGHTFWDEKFSKQFISILEDIYDLPETANMLWESIFIKNLDKLKMRIQKYPDGTILEFDTLDELRLFDESYIGNSRSKILKKIAKELDCMESELTSIRAITDDNSNADGIIFHAKGKEYKYLYSDSTIKEI